MTQREAHLQKIRQTEQALAEAKEGPHKRDLERCLKSLIKQLRNYDRWHAERRTA